MITPSDAGQALRVIERKIIYLGKKACLGRDANIATTNTTVLATTTHIPEKEIKIMKRYTVLKRTWPVLRGPDL
jgi:hypothetical protein